jgi:NADH:ubiquinone oxidoreductase subunit E
MKNQCQNPAIEQEISAIIAAYPSPQLALLPAIQRLADEADGGRQFVERLAVMCEVSESTVKALLAEYPSPGRTVESGRLCTGLSCVLSGARRILKHRSDGNEEYSWMGSKIDTVGCLGRCFAAPVFVDSMGCVHQVRVTAVE